jgi:hypothetical protein
MRYRALEDADAATKPPRFRLAYVSFPAPMGSRKTSFSQAFIAALVRLAALVIIPRACAS